MLAIFIACMGLYGMAAFMSEQRVKEIGIRKVLGATVPGIIMLLSKEILCLLAISAVIAWPIIFIVTRNWLDTFAYRTDIHIETYFIATFLVFFIGFMTILWQAVKAAVSNPINNFIQPDASFPIYSLCRSAHR